MASILVHPDVLTENNVHGPLLQLKAVACRSRHNACVAEDLQSFIKSKFLSFASLVGQTVLHKFHSALITSIRMLRHPSASRDHGFCCCFGCCCVTDSTCREPRSVALRAYWEPPFGEVGIHFVHDPLQLLAVKVLRHEFGFVVRFGNFTDCGTTSKEHPICLQPMGIRLQHDLDLTVVISGHVLYSCQELLRYHAQSPRTRINRWTMR